jgi:hypothetical protein
MRTRPRYTVARSGLQATVPLYLDQVTVNADGFITNYRIAFLPDFIDPGDIKAILREAINLDEPERCEVYDEDDRYLEGHPGTPRWRWPISAVAAQWHRRQALRLRKTLNTDAKHDTRSDRAVGASQLPPRPCSLPDSSELRGELIALMRRASRGPGDLSASDFLMEACRQYAINDDDVQDQESTEGPMMPEHNHEAREQSPRFAHLSTGFLVARMNRATDFGYNDEEVELTRRLSGTGRAWRWTQTDPPRVEIYAPADTATATL